jgi:hypothetical protein
MQDLSHLALGSLGGAGASMSGGNTVADPAGPALSQTAPGSPGVLPPSPTHDQVVQTDRAPGEDFARLKNRDGSEGVRPDNSGGGWTTQAQPDRVWRQT